MKYLIIIALSFTLLFFSHTEFGFIQNVDAQSSCGQKNMFGEKIIYSKINVKPHPLFKDIANNLVVPVVEHGKEFDTFLNTQVYPILAIPVGSGIETLKQLRFDGLKLELDKFHGLDEAAKGELEKIREQVQNII